MKKAIIAALITVFAGWFFADWCYQLPQIGSVIAIAVMGAFIIYFNEEKKNPSSNQEKEDTKE